VPLPPLTVQSALQWGTEHLERRDDLREHAARDARQLLEVATGLSRVQMMTRAGQVLAEEEAGSFRGMVAQRRGGVPIQHLRGSQEFFGREFLVSPDVLIPRPETEHLVEEVLRLYTDRATPFRIVDVGTGSGILAVTLALEYPRSSVLALDISTPALVMAHTNAMQLGARNVRFAHSDLLAAAVGESFDLIVSNPPYIPLRESADLHPQVRDHEPHLALFGGEDGLDIFRRLIPQAAQHLRQNGWLLTETAGRTDALDELLSDWKNPHSVRDLQGIERIIAAQTTKPVQNWLERQARREGNLADQRPDRQREVPDFGGSTLS
jgi:release factor glutamine methyltransferase